MKKFKLSKKNYLLGFLIVTGVLALVRIIRPDVAGTHYSDQIDHSSLAAADSIGDEMVASNDGGVAETKESDATRLLGSSDIPFALTNFFNPDGSERRRVRLDGRGDDMGRAEAFEPRRRPDRRFRGPRGIR